MATTPTRMMPAITLQAIFGPSVRNAPGDGGSNAGRERGAIFSRGSPCHICAGPWGAAAEVASGAGGGVAAISRSTKRCAEVRDRPPATRSFTISSIDRPSASCCRIEAERPPGPTDMAGHLYTSARVGRTISATPRYNSSHRMQTFRYRAVLAGLLLAAACSSDETMMDVIDGFDGERLERATEWRRGGIMGAVYVRPGEKMPEAELQVGVIISDEHELATELQGWIAEMAAQSTEQRYYTHNFPTEACVVGLNERERFFIAVTKCANADGRSACVQVDEPLDSDLIGRCAGSTSCPEQCESMWEERREQLIELVVQVLER